MQGLQVDDFEGEWIVLIVMQGSGGWCLWNEGSWIEGSLVLWLHLPIYKSMRNSF